MLQRIILITLTLCLCIFGCSCYEDRDFAHLESEVVYTKSEEVVPDERITITTEKDVYSVNDSTISYAVTVASDIDLEETTIIQGQHYVPSSPSSLEKLQILREDGWYDVPFRTDTLVVFPLPNSFLKVGVSLMNTVDLSYYFKLPLSKGTYRIYNHNVYSNTFTIE